MNEKKPTRRRSDLPRIGWREWIALPDFGIDAVKAKVDTGARTSSIHALHIEPYESDGKSRVRFQIHPLQRDAHTTAAVDAEVIEYRHVRSSTGHASLRPVVVTTVRLYDVCWEIELTLTSRDQMGFRMLLGREAVRGRFLIDASKSFLAGKRSVKKASQRKSGEQ